MGGKNRDQMGCGKRFSNDIWLLEGLMMHQHQSEPQLYVPAD